MSGRAHSTDQAQGSERLQSLLASQKRWRKGDVFPPEVVRFLLALSGGDWLGGALASIASKSKSGARFAAVWLETVPDHPWPGELAVAIAGHLSGDATEDDSLAFQALRDWASRDLDVCRRLLLTWVNECSLENVQPDLLWVCESLRTRDAPLFLEAAKRCALLTGDAPALAGALFAGLPDQSPEFDPQIRVFLQTARKVFLDAEWLTTAREGAVLDLLRDVLNLACALFCQPLFKRSLEDVLAIVRLRAWTAPVAPSAAAPLVLLKGAVVDLAPWLEESYRSTLASSDEAYAVEIRTRLTDGYYRELKRNAVIERKQQWRQWAIDRGRLHGTTCTAVDCRK